MRTNIARPACNQNISQHHTLRIQDDDLALKLASEQG
jgi:hypothetical protein